jgi:4,5:9,10-diseco-3-hydroxy-5,9,17-trioxoandrosta-1(10),2-diene-4-oate hydrolase
VVDITNTPADIRQVEIKEKYITLAGNLQVHYLEAGPENAPAVILTHGFLASSGDWRFNIKELAAITTNPRRIIAVDWPGFGRSDKGERAYSLFFYSDFLKEFAGALGLKQFDLIGHSMGGKHNLAFAVLNPTMVRKMVLVGTDGFIKDPWWADKTARWWYRPLEGLQLKFIKSPKLLKMFARNVYVDPKFYPTEAEILEGSRRLSDPAYMDSLKALNYNYPALSLTLTGLRSRLAEVKHPVLIIWGKQDKIIHVSCAELASSELTNSRLHLFDNCGHMPQVEKAEEFNKLVSDFLDEV